MTKAGRKRSTAKSWNLSGYRPMTGQKVRAGFSTGMIAFSYLPNRVLELGAGIAFLVLDGRNQLAQTGKTQQGHSKTRNSKQQYVPAGH
jgi:hypothetical protein